MLHQTRLQVHCEAANFCLMLNFSLLYSEQKLPKTTAKTNNNYTNYKVEQTKIPPKRKFRICLHHQDTLKVHCHAIQCFYVDFFAVENGGEETRGRGAGQRFAGLDRTFFSSPVRSLVIDRRRSISESVTLAKSFLSRTKLGFEIWSRKLKQTHFPWMVKNSWNPKQACRAPRIDLELSWSDDRSRLAIFQVQLHISLHSTMYTTIIDRQDTCWVRFVWKDARLPLFSPTTKWHKKSLNSVTVHL